MHNELIKKYEKEIKLNTSRVEQITRLSVSTLAFPSLILSNPASDISLIGFPARH